jgi:ABC-type nitrate/sulfonate/bicarbonate transport system permease component
LPEKKARDCARTVWGLKAPEADVHHLFRTMRAEPAQIFRKLRVPYCLPYFFSAPKNSTSLAIVGAIVGAEHGLGYLIIISSAHLETPTCGSHRHCHVLFSGIRRAQGGFLGDSRA